MITYRDVSKSFGKTQALRGASFSLGKGSVNALCGPNGAGKTTALRALAGLISFDGSLTVENADWGPYARGRDPRFLFYVPEERDFRPGITVKDLCGEILALSRGSITAPSLDEKLELLGINDSLHKKARDLSSGQKTSLYLAFALSSSAGLLVLDEPLTGLDPLVREAFISRLKEKVAADGLTVVYSSHVLEEVETAADRIVILSRGRCLFEGTIDEAKDTYMEVITDDPENPAGLPGVVSARKDRSGAQRLFALRNSYIQRPGDRVFPVTLKDIFLYLAGMDARRGRE